MYSTGMGQKEEIIQILEEASTPLSDSEIADQLGVTTSGMWQARKRLLDDETIEGIGSNPQRWRLNGGSVDISEPTESSESTSGKSKASIRLERNLEKYMLDDLSNIEAGLTTIDEGDSQQRKVESGFLDILAKDENGNPVVIELKAGEAKHDALGQAMSYMADIADEFTDGSIRGIIVAKSFSKQLISAVSIQANVELYRYTVQFSFDKADE